MEEEVDVEVEKEKEVDVDNLGYVWMVPLSSKGKIRAYVSEFKTSLQVKLRGNRELAGYI